MAVRNYRELVAWQKSMQLVTDIYRASKVFPREETFGLSSQLKRAVISIPSNIAEGQGRDSVKEFVYHLSVAYGSLMETETQLQIACDLGYIGKSEVGVLLAQTAEVGKLMNGLSRSLKQAS